jgi:hypothetical protein
MQRFTEFRAFFVETNTEQAVRYWCKTRANMKPSVCTGGMDGAS